MAHQIADFEIHAGDDLVIPVEVTDNGKPSTDPDDPGTPIDLTDVSEITFAAADRDESDTRSITYKLSTTGIAVIDAVAGRYNITIAKADTFGKSGWKTMQSRVTDTLGNKFTAFEGLLNINKSILLADE